MKKLNQGAQQGSCVQGASQPGLMAKAFPQGSSAACQSSLNRAHLTGSCLWALGLPQEWPANTSRGFCSETWQSAGLGRSCFTVQTTVCTVSHLAKPRQTGKQMLLSSLFFSCCCLKKGLERSSAVRTGSPSRGKGKHQKCHFYGPICPMPYDLQAFLSIILCAFCKSLCMVGLSSATAAPPLLSPEV